MLKNLKIKVLSLLIIFTIIITNINVIASDIVQVNVVNNPKVDILLTSNQTSLDLSNFENDVKLSLQAKGIDTSNIKIQIVGREYVESEDADFAQVVNT